jgi:hypothetical protein
MSVALWKGWCEVREAGRKGKRERLASRLRKRAWLWFVWEMARRARAALRTMAGVREGCFWWRCVIEGAENTRTWPSWVARSGDTDREYVG